MNRKKSMEKKFKKCKWPTAWQMRLKPISSHKTTAWCHHTTVHCGKDKKGNFRF